MLQIEVEVRGARELLMLKGLQRGFALELKTWLKATGGRGRLALGLMLVASGCTRPSC